MTWLIIQAVIAAIVGAWILNSYVRDKKLSSYKIGVPTPCKLRMWVAIFFFGYCALQVGRVILLIWLQ